MGADTRPEDAERQLENRLCRATKHGGIDLTCALGEGHDKPGKDGEPATWHEATVTRHETIEYPGAHHEITVTEHVTWEPVDHIREAVRHMLHNRPSHA